MPAPTIISEAEATTSAGQETSSITTEELAASLAKPRQEEPVEEPGQDELPGDDHGAEAEAQAEELLSDQEENPEPLEEEEDDATDAEEDPEVDPDEEEEESEESEEEEEPTNRQQEKFQKRVNKLTAKTKYLEEQLEAVTAERDAALEVQSKFAGMPAPNFEHGPLAEADSPSDVDEKVRMAMAVKRWCHKNPHGGEVEFNGETIELDSDTVADRLSDAEETIQVHAPNRKQFLADRAKYRDQMRQLIPWTQDKKDPLYHTYQQVLARRPHYKAYADGELEAAVNILGLQKLQEIQDAKKAKKAPAKKPAKRSNPPKVVSRPTAAARRGKPSSRKVEAARSKFKETGSTADLAEMFVAQTQR